MQEQAVVEKDFIAEHAVSKVDFARFGIDEDGGIVVPESLIGCPFPLRDIYPDAVGFLVRENRLTVAQRRNILEWVGQDVDAKDAEAFYNTFLDFVEQRPAAGHILELVAMGATKTKKHKINNKPAFALRLARRMDKKELLDQALLPDPPRDLIMGLFFECVLAHYEHLPEVYSRPKDIFEQWFPAVNPENDPALQELKVLTETLDELIELGEEYKDGVDPDITLAFGATILHDHEAAEIGDRRIFNVRKALAQYMLAVADETTPIEHYDQIIDLVEALKAEDFQLHTFDAAAVAQELEEAGLCDWATANSWLGKQAGEEIPELVEQLCALYRALAASIEKCQSLQAHWTAETGLQLASGNMQAVQEAAGHTQSAQAASQSLEGARDDLKNALAFLLDEASINAPGLSEILTQHRANLQELSLPQEVRDLVDEYPAAVPGGFVSAHARSTSDDASVVGDDDTTVSVLEEDRTPGDHIQDEEEPTPDLAANPEEKRPAPAPASLDDTAAVPETENTVTVKPVDSPSPGHEVNLPPKDAATESPALIVSSKAPVTENKTDLPEPDLTKLEAPEDLNDGDLADEADLSLYTASLAAEAPGIGSIISQALIAQSKTPYLRPQAFLAASSARAVGFEYTPVIGALTEHISQVQEPNEIEATLLFAAALKPSIFAPDAQMRPTIAELNLGSFGPHLSDLQSAIADLPYAFPPSFEQLAHISGAPTDTRRARLMRRLEAWMEETSQRSGVCQPSTRFLHTIVKPGGIVGSAVIAMKGNAKNAASLALEAADKIDGHDAIEAGYRAISTPTGPRSTTRLSPKAMDHMARHTSEAVELLRNWAKAEEKQVRAADASAQRALMVLKAALAKSRDSISERIQLEDDSAEGKLRIAVARMIQKTIVDVLTGLAGQETSDANQAASEEDAFLQDVDLLPPAIRRAYLSGDLDAALAGLYEAGIPDPDVAYALNIKAGAFATARRIAKRTAGDIAVRIAALHTAQVQFVESMSSDLRRLSRRIATAARLDFKNQDRYPALTDWCDEALEHLREQGEKDALLQDFDEYRARSEDISDTLTNAESSIRDDQRARVEDLRTPSNEEDADLVLRQIADNLGFEAVENRIARLRDGRSIADVEDQAENDILERFTPEFVEASADPAWPSSASDYVRAFSKSDTLLATSGDRAENAAELMSLFFLMREQTAKQTPKGKPIVNLLQGLGFEKVNLDSGKAIEGARAWRYQLRASVAHQGWFLPPVFGKRANGLYRMILCEAKTLPEVLSKSLDPQTPSIILVSGCLERSRRHEFAKRLRQDRIPAVLIDETLIAYAAIRQDTRLRTIFTCGMPYGRIEPYETNAGALPEEMFFGREDEIERIMSFDYEGCLVYGGRQLGKSALLAHVEKLYHDPANGQIVVRDQVTNLGLQDEPAVRVWSKIHTLLSHSEFGYIVREDSKDNPDAIRHDIKMWVTQSADPRRVIVLLDETDEFITAEAMSGFPEITKLKDLMETTSRRFKIVFAGLHNVQSMHSTGNSPLPHLRTPTVIGPLNRTREDRQAAYDLVTEPLRAAGFRFETPQAADRILSYTNEYPSLVQEFMSGLIAQRHRMLGRNYALSEDGPSWIIPDAELFDHEGFEDIERQIRKKFHLTLNLDVRYALVAYTMAYIAEYDRTRALLDGMRAREILEEASDYWPTSVDRLEAEEFEVILDEMCDLGVLGKVDVGTTTNQPYCLRSPEVIPMLGSPSEIAEELLRIQEREPKPRYDRATNRRLVPSDNKDSSRRQYLPLTDLQVERLLDRGVNEPRIVCGLKMLGLERIPRHLQRIAQDTSLPGVSPDKPVSVFCAEDQRIFRAHLDQKPGKQDEMKVVLLHHSGSAHDAQRILDMSSRRPLVTNGLVRPILLLNAEDPECRDLATRNLYATETLAPWGPDALRVHLRHVEATELDKKEIREAILTATGGIPEHVLTSVERLRSADDRRAVLEDLSFEINARDFQTNAPRMIAALDLIAGYDNRQASQENYDFLNEMLVEETGKDLVTLVPDLKAMGLIRQWVPSRCEISVSSLAKRITQADAD
ncbi:hypothetical protein [Roseobacter sp. S98]|uniref:hypothetical protein n=1 Tax=Roseobacter algicola (ex Choi et al. 2025) (nom. illeg.) TaxID=3092138 RepID=UPI003F519D07